MLAVFPQVMLPLSVSPGSDPAEELHTGILYGGLDEEGQSVVILLHEGIVASLYVCAAAQSTIEVAALSALDDVAALSLGITSRPSPAATECGGRFVNVLQRFDRVYRPSLVACRFAHIPDADSDVVEGVFHSDGEQIHIMFSATIIRDGMWDCLLRGAWVVADSASGPFRELITDLVPDFFESDQDGQEA